MIDESTAVFCNSNRTMVKGNNGGRQQLYKHFGQDPVKPHCGWNRAEANTSNPDFAFLVNDIVAKPSFDQAAALREPHKIYNQYQQLYRINPWKFPDFLQKAIKYHHRMSQQSDSASSSSSIPTVPSATDSPTQKMSSHRSSSSIPQSVHSSHGSSSNGTSVDTFDERGIPVHTNPIISEEDIRMSKMRKVHLPADVIEHRNGCDVVITPLPGMSIHKTSFTQSTLSDKSYHFLYEDETPMASKSTVENMLTSGDYEILHDEGGKDRVDTIKLDHEDPNVTAYSSHVESRVGQETHFTQPPCLYQHVSVPKPGDPELSGRWATGGFWLPAKYEIINKKTGRKRFVFSVRYKSAVKSMNYGRGQQRNDHGSGGGGGSE